MKLKWKTSTNTAKDGQQKVAKFYANADTFEMVNKKKNAIESGMLECNL